MQDLIREASQFNLLDDIGYITEVFKELEKFLTDKTPASETVELTKRSVFPVSKSVDGPGFDCLLSSDIKHQWWIADTMHLAESFKGIIPLLAIDVEDIGRLKRLFKAAKVELRKLSHDAEGIAHTDGYIESWPDYTKSLQGKANSILR